MEKYLIGNSCCYNARWLGIGGSTIGTNAPIGGTPASGWSAIELHTECAGAGAPGYYEGDHSDNQVVGF